MLDLKQGQFVRFKCADKIGVGKVCGISSIEAPIIGRGVILEILDDEDIDPSVYPFSHRVVFEVYIEQT